MMSTGKALWGEVMTESAAAADRPRSRGFDPMGAVASDVFPPAPPLVKVDVQARLYPTERSRLTLAMCGAAFPALFCVVLLPILPLLAFIWVLRQLNRAWLLGNSVEVSAETLPEIQSVIDDVRARLDYHERVEVYVVRKSSPEMVVSSYMGSKILLVEGDFVGELVRTGDRAQLTYLIAQQFGALKARHLRMTVVAVVVQSFRGLWLLNFLLLPYLRATAYSGDQIAQACCGSMEAALAAIDRQGSAAHRRPGGAHRTGSRAAHADASAPRPAAPPRAAPRQPLPEPPRAQPRRQPDGLAPLPCRVGRRDWIAARSARRFGWPFRLPVRGSSAIRCG